MTWDPSSQAVVLFRGFSLASGQLNDTWEFKGGSWSNVTTNSSGATPPSPTIDAGFAADPSLPGAILFGSENASGDPTNATYAFESGRWTQALTVTAPPERSGPALTFDASLGGLVLFGGHYPPLGPGFSDTWVYSSGSGRVPSTWMKLTPVASPPGLSGAAMAFDVPDHEVVLFGGIGPTGFSNDTWVLVNVTSPTGPVDWVYLGAFGLAVAGGLVALVILVQRSGRARDAR